MWTAISAVTGCVPRCRALPLLGLGCRPPVVRPAWSVLPQRPEGVRQRQLPKSAAAARSEDEVQPVPPAMLSQHGSDDELADEGEWVAGMITCWLDEEWPAVELVEVHASLGSTTGQAYKRVRRQEGMLEMGDLVLALANELLAFNYRETFVNAFDISNKVVELLMLRDGRDVCCTSESDRTAIERYEAQLAAGRQ